MTDIEADRRARGSRAMEEHWVLPVRPKASPECADAAHTDPGKGRHDCVQHVVVYELRDGQELIQAC